MSKKLYFSIVLLFFIFAFPATASWILLFGSKDCSDCEAVKAAWPEDFAAGHKPSLVFLEIENSANYQLLGKIEQLLQIEEPASSFPLFLLGRRLISDIDEFYELEDEYLSLAAQQLDLPELQALSDYVQSNPAALLTWNVPVALNTKQPPSSVPASPASSQLLYFLQKGCQNCSRQLRELQQLAKVLPGLQVDCYDIGTEEGQLMLQRARQVLHLPDGDENITPMLAWENGYIAHRLARAEELLEIMQNRQDDAEPPFWKTEFSADERRSLQAGQGQLLRRATVGVIAAAGLIDGINPCAFATSIFLIGYLLYLKRRAREIILIGFCFCLGVFVSYLLFGLGFSFLIDFLQQLYWLKTALYLIFALLAGVFAFMHLRDALRYRRSGKSSDMEMGLSLDTHRKIHKHIKHFTRFNSWMLIPAALVLGAIVSSLELACTGQIYLPTLAAINSAGMQWRAFNLLLLYNFFFIVPLLIVTGLAAYGVGAQSIAKWARNNVFGTKVSMSLLFFCLTLLMTVMAWHEWPGPQKPSAQVNSIDCLSN